MASETSGALYVYATTASSREQLTRADSSGIYEGHSRPLNQQEQASFTPFAGRGLQGEIRLGKSQAMADSWPIGTERRDALEEPEAKSTLFDSRLTLGYNVVLIILIITNK